jgi:uncharacterized membrane protein
MRPAASPSGSDNWANISRAFKDFLALPALMVIGFILLAVVVYILDRNSGPALDAVRDVLKHRLITDADATTTLLSTITSAVITVTSITFSLLLLTVQQSAAALTNQVLDQFLHRRSNQAYFGVFVGVSVFALLILATNDTRVTPVFGATMAVILMALSMVMLVMLVYTTLTQMRPERIIEEIHDAALKARRRERLILSRTRRERELTTAPTTMNVVADSNGYLAPLNLDEIGKATSRARGEVEVNLLVCAGDYVCFGDSIAEVAAQNDSDARALVDAVQRALRLERQRDYKIDPGSGVSQLVGLGWTSISTAKSNPWAGLTAIYRLRDLLVRWLQKEDTEAESSSPSKPAVPVVYRDALLEGIIEGFESLLLVSSESMQHQCSAEIWSTIAMTFGRMPLSLQDRTERVILAGLSSLGEQALTRRLDEALKALIQTLRDTRRNETATAVDEALKKFSRTVGELGSRDTRGKGGSGD